MTGAVHYNINGDKVTISGDDVLIDYSERLARALQRVPEYQLRPYHHSQVLKFISHYVWHQPDRVDVHSKMSTVQSQTLWARIHNRINEMKERRRRLVKLQYKKEGRLQDFERGYSI